MDSGASWGSRGDLPTDLVCWLAGLGVAVAANPPRRPEDNGVVERPQGVGQAWGEPWLRRSGDELRRRMDELDRWQRELYPAVRGMPRMRAYPELRHSGRPYDPGLTARVWDLGGAWGLMAAHLVPRDVSRQGKVSPYNRPYGAGLRWAGRRVWVGSDAAAEAWTFQDEHGHEIRRQIAPESSERLVNIVDVIDSRRGVHAANPMTPPPRQNLPVRDTSPALEEPIGHHARARGRAGGRFENRSLAIEYEGLKTRWIAVRAGSRRILQCEQDRAPIVGEVETNWKDESILDAARAS